MPETARAGNQPSTSTATLLHAARLRTLPAAAAPVLVGVGLAWSNGVFALLPALTALVCALLIQVGTNFANDYYDFVHGADTDERSGEMRVTQAGLVEPDQVKAWMVTTMLLAVALGGYLVYIAGWPILVIGLASVAAGILYTGGPWPFGYHGLGDLFVLVFFGLVAVSGTYYVQALAWSIPSLVAGAGIGALATAILVVNNLRDIATDPKAGKRTLAVLLGPGFTRAEYVTLLLVAGAVPILGVAFFAWHPASLLATGSLGLAIEPARKVLTLPPPHLDPALAETARALAAYGLLLAVGVAL